MYDEDDPFYLALDKERLQSERTVNSALRKWITEMKIGTNFGTEDVAALVSRFNVKEPERQAMCELERLRNSSKNILFAYMTRYGYCRSSIWEICGGTGSPTRGRYVRLTVGDPLCHWWTVPECLDGRFMVTKPKFEITTGLEECIAECELDLIHIHEQLRIFRGLLRREKSVRTR